MFYTSLHDIVWGSKSASIFYCYSSCYQIWEAFRQDTVALQSKDLTKIDCWDIYLINTVCTVRIWMNIQAFADDLCNIWSIGFAFLLRWNWRLWISSRSDQFKSNIVPFQLEHNNWIRYSCNEGSLENSILLN